MILSGILHIDSRLKHAGMTDGRGRIERIGQDECQAIFRVVRLRIGRQGCGWIMAMSGYEPAYSPPEADEPPAQRLAGALPAIPRGVFAELIPCPLPPTRDLRLLCKQRRGNALTSLSNIREGLQGEFVLGPFPTNLVRLQIGLYNFLSQRRIAFATSFGDVEPEEFLSRREARTSRMS